jgi:hypothetical protein
MRIKLSSRARWICLAIAGILVWTGVMTAVNWSVEDYANQATASLTCPVVQTAQVNQVVGVGNLTTLSNANNCDFTMPSYAALTVNWKSDPHGKWFARSIAAVPTPTFHLTKSVVATNLLKETGLYFDANGRIYTVVAYGDVGMPSAVAVARMIATHG